MEPKTITISQNLQKCQENLKSFWQQLRLSWLDYLPTVISPAPLCIRIGPFASVVLTVIATNRRYLVGGLFLGLGVLSLFLHQFFPESERNWHWYWVNNFYFVFTLRIWILLICGSAAGMLFSPAKWKLAYIPFALLHAIGWLFILHYTVFVDASIEFTTKAEMIKAFAEAHERFHAVPHWYAFVMAGSLGVSIILSLDYLLYRYNHIIRNNHASCIGLLKIKDVPTEVREKHAATLVDNYTNINARV